MNIEDFRTYYLSFKGGIRKDEVRKSGFADPVIGIGNGIRETYGNGGFFPPSFLCPGESRKVT